MSAIEFLGETFEIPEKINERRLLKLAKHASDGEDSGSMAGMGALEDLIAQCVRGEDAKRFDDLCDREGVSIQQLFEFTAMVIGALGQRPTVRPAVSSAGPTPTQEKSASRVEELATDRFPGRPDLVLAATRSAKTTRSA